MGLKKSFVYIGLKEGNAGGFWVKVGKSNNPEKRAKAYFTHCPGGLRSMYAAQRPSQSDAFATELRLTVALSQIHGVSQVAGEWLYVSSDALDEMFAVFQRVAGTPIHVQTCADTRFALIHSAY